MQSVKIVTNDDIDQSKEYTWNDKELHKFREMVLREKNLNSRTDDMFLLSFLRSRKYDLKNALHLLKNYYAVRRKLNELFKNLRPSALEHVLNTNIMSYVCIDGEKFVGFGRASHWDTSKLSAIDILRGIMLNIDFTLNFHQLQVNGLWLLVDVNTLTWKHVVCFTPLIIKIMVTCFYKTLPLSYKSVHLVNVNKYLYAIAALVYPFLPSKLKQRIHFNGANFEDLHKEIDPKYLPVEFGGTLESFDWSVTNQLMRENEEFFVENEKYWNNENTN